MQKPFSYTPFLPEHHTKDELVAVTAVGVAGVARVARVRLAFLVAGRKRYGGTDKDHRQGHKDNDEFAHGFTSCMCETFLADRHGLLVPEFLVPGQEGLVASVMLGLTPYEGPALFEANVSPAARQGFDELAFCGASRASWSQEPCGVLPTGCFRPSCGTTCNITWDWMNGWKRFSVMI